MAIGRFLPPKHWEDWLVIALGIWFWVSPWVLGFAGNDMPATQNAFLVGLLLIVASTVVIFAFRPWEQWINIAIGAWLVVSPWALDIPTTLVMANFVVVGLLVLGLALYEVRDLLRHAHAA